MAAMNEQGQQGGRDQPAAGREILARPVLPLVGMVEFLFVTGGFSRVEEVIDQLPAPIETPYAVYECPGDLLCRHLDILRLLEDGASPLPEVLDVDGNPLERGAALDALIRQRVLTRELETVNSALCAPCGCTLCCVGPDQEMRQEFFEIPLTGSESDLFDLARVDSPASRQAASGDEPVLTVDGRPFYRCRKPLLVRWRNGWGLILPRKTRCPHLDDQGRCRIYPQRPEVCRRPQIFPYVLEPLAPAADGSARYRLRNALLAVVDCPYVSRLRETIAGYGAACELEVIFRRNKE